MEARIRLAKVLMFSEITLMLPLADGLPLDIRGSFVFHICFGKEVKVISSHR